MTNSIINLEVCAFNLPSALVAQQVGAHRVELCDNAADGGTTPSYGTLVEARERLSIDLYPIVRPRGGHFVYSDEEWAIMKRDIRFCREIGCEGISTGVQLPDGTIDTIRLGQLVEWAYPLEVTCHRVFDHAPDLLQALEAVIDCGCTRILTSGGAATAPQGTAMLTHLVEAAAGRIGVMAGAGVRSGNIADLRQATGATEFHTSARSRVSQGSIYQNPAIVDVGTCWLADEQELKAILAQLAQG